MKTKYEKLEDDDVYIMKQSHILRFACCDCGLVHTHAFLIRDNSHYKRAKKQNGRDFLKKNEIGISVKRERGSTAQLRRHDYGYLQRPIKSDRYKLVRVK